MTASAALSEPSALPTLPLEGRTFGLSQQRSVVQEMLLTLESVTRAGQRHLMEKLVDLLREHVQRLSPGLGRSNQLALSELCDHLELEAGDTRPDLRQFSNGVLGLMALLTGLSSEATQARG